MLIRKSRRATCTIKWLLAPSRVSPLRSENCCEIPIGTDKNLYINESSKIYDGNTYLLFTIQYQNLQLCNIILGPVSQQHYNYTTNTDNDSNNNSIIKDIGIVLLTNSNGISYIKALQDILETNNKLQNREVWEEFLIKLKFHEVQEKNIIENHNCNRQRVNEEHRER